MRVDDWNRVDKIFISMQNDSGRERGIGRLEADDDEVTTWG